jgi:hypothetical protein
MRNKVFEERLVQSQAHDLFSKRASGILIKLKVIGSLSSVACGRRAELLTALIYTRRNAVISKLIHSNNKR